ncbi:MAG: FAD-dependent oxidoreductase [Planctomycetaceae bacterium]|nr:FAD-dependent oxidoreductase [Planctomycetaceae bacterium]
MKIAIVGTGISGLVCAHLLGPKHDVTLFEANDYVGGHTHTVDVELDGRTLPVDTGFIVCNDWTYPNFLALLDELGVATSPTSMSFSVHCDHCGLEYSGSSLSSLFCQKRNFGRPSFYRLLADILRFNRIGSDPGQEFSQEETVGEFIRRCRLSEEFARHYLLPMGAAIWSCPMETFSDFPIRFIIDFYRNHGLLNIWNRPTWRTVDGGSRTYVERILERFSGDLRLKSPVSRISRHEDGVDVHSQGRVTTFDEVILACHSDQALRMVDGPSKQESQILSELPYSDNIAILHTDTRLLPQRRKAWAAWNYHVRSSEETRPSVTYNMNILQHLPTEQTVCVTLNEEESIAPDKILGKYNYSHPYFSPTRASAQSRHTELIRHDRLSYCGAYWQNGFHEDGVHSALTVCKAFNVFPSWQDSKPAEHPNEALHKELASAMSEANIGGGE